MLEKAAPTRLDSKHICKQLQVKKMLFGSQKYRLYNIEFIFFYTDTKLKHLQNL